MIADAPSPTRARLIAALPWLGILAVGVSWGAGAPLVRIARLEGWSPVALIFWHSVLGLVALGLVLWLRGRLAIPRDRASLKLYLAVALLGIVLPHLAGFWALAHVPAAAHSVIISLVPLFALALALGLRIERFRALRFTGLMLGAGAVALLILPEASLPPGTASAWLLVSMLAPFCYALEGLVIANFSRAQSGPLQTLFGATIVALVLVAPVALAQGAGALPFRPWGVAEWAVAISGVTGALTYAGYVAILRHAGSVFGAQVAYVVTTSGVLWAMLLLGERPSPWFWGALGLLFAGLVLVQPRPAAPLADPPGT